MMKNGRQGEWSICTKCSGEGMHSQRLGSFTASEWDEAGHEFQEDYMRGTFDDICERCRGSGKLWLDTGPHLSDEELAHPDNEDLGGSCPCAACAAERHRADYEDARQRWAEDGGREEFYYEG